MTDTRVIDERLPVPVADDFAVHVRGLRMSFGGTEVLRGLDFDVRRGEVFCLLGPNGAGKTTTLEILEGFRAPTGGQVRVLGLDPAAQPARLRERAGIVLQECGFPRQVRVAELIDLWRSYYPNPRPLGELLEVVELAEARNTQVRRLSGGQRRRLDFALALTGDPELIFLDEPTTGFDPDARREAWTMIRGLRALGKTILLTTHYMDEAQQLADPCPAGKRGIGTFHPYVDKVAHEMQVPVAHQCPGQKACLAENLEAVAGAEDEFARPRVVDHRFHDR